MHVSHRRSDHRDQVVALTDDQLESLRAMLTEQRSFRIDQLAQLHVPGPHGPLSSTIPEIFGELAAGARAALHDVQAALWRLEDGVYGRCTGCNGPVGLERLEILPQSALCLPCQREADAG